MRSRISRIGLGQAASVAGLSVMLASCGMVDGRRDGRPHSLPRPLSRPLAHPVSDLPVKVGAPYTVRGVTYTPVDPASYDEVGYASWYGEEQNGNPTANGEAFFASAVAAAHRTLPLPSYVEVTALDSGRTILVRVNDRGPFAGGRLIDLTRGAAEQLGITRYGTAAVRVRLVHPPERERARLRAGERVAERDLANPATLAALRARLTGGQSLAGQANAVVPVAKLAPLRSDSGYVVQVATFSSKDRAAILADRIGAAIVRSGDLWRVRYGPYGSADAARSGLAQAASKGFRDAQIMAND